MTSMRLIIGKKITGLEITTLNHIKIYHVSKFTELMLNGELLFTGMFIFVNLKHDRVSVYNESLSLNLLFTGLKFVNSVSFYF